MYEINKDLDTRQKFTKHIYFDTVIALIITFTVSYLISLIFKDFFIQNLFVFFCLIIVFIFCLENKNNPGKKNITSIYYFFKRNKETVKSMEKTEKKSKVNKKMLDYLSILGFTERKYLIHRNNLLSEILEIKAMNLNNLTESQRNSLVKKNSEFYLSYSSDIKIVYLNFPMKFEEEKIFLEEKIKVEKDSYKLQMLNLKLEELNLLEEYKTKKGYFLFIYGRNEIELSENIKQVKEFFVLPVKNISLEEKEFIFKKYNNLNALIWVLRAVLKVRHINICLTFKDISLIL